MNQALLKFQVGPVQEFIAQARSTRDLWSGSYLLSWLAGCVIDALEQRLAERSLPPARIVFPELTNGRSPMLDWITEPGWRTAPPINPATFAKAATLPTVPNQLLACVPDGFNAEDAKAVVNRVFKYGEADRPAASEWRRICDACRQFLANAEGEIPAGRRKVHLADKANLWHAQLASFWQTAWLLWPGEPLTEEAERELFAASAVGERWSRANPSVPPGDWFVRYHLASHRLDARRQTRDFAAWQGQPGLEKDSLSGKEEAIADRVWLKQIPRGQAGKGLALNHIFRHDDPLGAVNLVKRVWHKAYLEMDLGGGGMGLDKQRIEGEGARGSYFDIPSVPGIATFPWAREVWSRHHGNVFADAAFSRFWEVVEEIDRYLPLNLPKRREFHGEEPLDWLGRVDWGIFRESFWREQETLSQAATEPEWTKAASTGLAAVQQFIRDEKLGAPSAYYAVLAGDGDRVGLWLSGEDSRGRLFPLTLDFHQLMSGKVGDFAIQNTRRLVEDPRKMGSDQEGRFQGKVIYAGGDDLLGVLPADQAVQCALALRDAYRSCMPHRDGAEFTYSAGIAMGHIKQPLQDMVEAARGAKDRAKNVLGRNALAVTLFKRSGETIEWGCPFSHKQNNPSAALQLLQFMQADNRFRPKRAEPAYQPPISGKFPHRLAELLSPYQTYQEPDGLIDPSKPEPLTRELVDIAECEVRWAVQQHCENLPPDQQEGLRDLCRACLEELLDRGAPLRDFYHLFAVEAFIARQGE